MTSIANVAYQVQMQLFDDSLPARPYCSEGKTAQGFQPIRILPKESAKRLPYIQPNTHKLLVTMVFDLDFCGAGLQWERAGLPLPSWVAINPTNSHADIGYRLLVPVGKSELARTGTLRCAQAVEFAYASLLKADPGYAGLVCKNPLHARWKVLWGRAEPYELAELAEYVELPKKITKAQREYGLGRNCELFDGLRKWAYQWVRQYKSADSTQTQWFAAVLAHAEALNTFLEPLPHAEVKSTAKSVAKWVWTHFDEAGFSAIQANRGKRSGVVRKAKNEDKREAAAQLRAEGLSTRQIAEQMAVDQSSVVRWLR